MGASVPILAPRQPEGPAAQRSKVECWSGSRCPASTHNDRSVGLRREALHSRHANLHRDHPGRPCGGTLAGGDPGPLPGPAAGRHPGRRRLRRRAGTRERLESFRLLRVKLDENLSRHLIAEMRALGHDASTAADQGLLGRSDREVAVGAKGAGEILFTLDLEFGDLRKYPPGSHPGIILFRPRSMGPRPLALSSPRLSVPTTSRSSERVSSSSIRTGCAYGARLSTAAHRQKQKRAKRRRYGSRNASSTGRTWRLNQRGRRRSPFGGRVIAFHSSKIFRAFARSTTMSP